MALIIRRKHWTIKPPAGSVLNFGHPLAKDLIGVWIFAGGGQSFVDSGPYAQGQGTLGGAPQIVAGEDGGAYQGNGTSTYFNVTRKGSYYPTGNKPLTILARVNPAAAALMCAIQLGQVTDTNWNFAFGLNASLQPCMGGNDNLTNDNSVNSVTQGLWSTIGVSHSNEFARSWFTNGKIDSTTGTGTNGITAGGLRIGALGNAASSWNGRISWIYGWNRALSVPEMQWLYAEPYALFLPQSPRVRYFIAPAGGTVNPLTLNAAMAAWAAALGRGTQKTLSAAPSAWAGALAKNTLKSSGLAAAPSAWSAALVKLTGKSSNLSAATAAFAGALTTAKVKVQALAASMAAWSATLARQTQKNVTASMAAWSAALSRIIAKQIAASMSAWSGALAKRAGKALSAATAAFAGAISSTKVKLQALAASMAAFSGSLARQTGKSVTGSMAAWAATLPRRTGKGIAATMASWAAALNKSTLKSLAGSMAAWLGSLVGLKSGTLPGPFVGCSGVRVYLMLMSGTNSAFPQMAIAASRSYPGMLAGSFQVLGANQ